MQSTEPSEGPPQDVGKHNVLAIARLVELHLSTVAIFHAAFHPTQGNVIDWALKANDGLYSFCFSILVGVLTVRRPVQI